MRKILRYILTVCFLASAPHLWAQQEPEDQPSPNQQSNIEKLDLLVERIRETLENSPGTALRYVEDALEYAELLKEDDLTYRQTQVVNRREADAYYYEGLAYEKLGDDSKAISSFRKARRIAQRTQYEEMTEASLDKLGEYGKGEGFEVKVAKGAKSIISKAQEWALKDTSSNSQLKNAVKSTVIASNEIKAEKAIEENDYSRAIKFYKKNIPYHKTYGDTVSLQSTYLKIADLYSKQGNQKEKNRYTLLATGRSREASEPDTDEKEVFAELFKDLADIEVFSQESSREEKEARNFLSMAERKAKEGKYEESNDYYKQFILLQQKLKEAEIRSQSTRSMMDSQLVKIQLLTAEYELQEGKMREAQLKTQRNRSIALGFLGVALLLGVLFFFNRRSHKKLTHTYKELAHTHSQLKDTQSQLVSAEKMASLGQLTAGIAHEINNPVNFISGNIDPLKNDFADLMTILHAYEEAVKSDNVAEKLKAVEKLKEELEIDYVTEEIQDLLNGINEGANRTTEIVRGLRTFARLDEGARKPFNVQESLDSTLLLLQHKTADIQIVRDYRPTPEIEGFPGKINQVFMNLLDNAIQAMPKGGTIYLTTQAFQDQVEIRIKDTGMGIPDKIKSRIFEPFFTTKDVGDGTGLGLSISLGIIEQHKGTIDIQSEQGQGTEIVIRLPLGE